MAQYHTQINNDTEQDSKICPKICVRA